VNLDLAGRTAVVTGASKGIGLAVTLLQVAVEGTGSVRDQGQHGQPRPVETALWLGPGGVAETLGQAQGRDPEAVRKDAVAGTPTGRFTRADEVAQVVLLLASGTAGNVTGTDVLIDGGPVSTI
jgi:NAD(P)-dependent dehydrogenase (short-subunit alcohol dehydrogenase family)